MKTLFVFLFAFLFGVMYAGIRMTDDKKEGDLLKIKRVEDGVVLFIPKDDTEPYKVGDIYQDDKLIRYVVIEEIKAK